MAVSSDLTKREKYDLFLWFYNEEKQEVEKKIKKK